MHKVRNESPIPPADVLSEPRFRVAEIFGPTIQGEGPDAGRPCYFVRFGSCDYRCTWCDSMHAVLPEKVKLLPWMTATEIVEKLNSLPGKFPLVILSGGNPALWDLSSLLDELDDDSSRCWEVAVETQGTRFQQWMTRVDTVVVSPKPPSSGMKTDFVELDEVMSRISADGGMSPIVAVKVVIFDREDLKFAFEVQEKTYTPEIYLSIGTNPDDTRDTLLNRLHDMIPDVMDLYSQKDVSFIIAPQMHVLIWGHALGV